MNLSEISAGTPKVLSHCLELFLDPHPSSSEMHQFRSAPTTPAKYASHPDIQFFRLVKAKHHYAYHKLKTAVHDGLLDHTREKAPSFDPYSRDLLLQRLRTYNALNWHIPATGQGQVELNELICAAAGWTCESIARNNNTKNHLKCTGCEHDLVLRFNSVEQQPAFTPFQFDLEDINQLNHNLKLLYLEQIHLTAHAAACPWTKVQTPLRGVYYLAPHISTTNETYIGEYLKSLRNLTDNLPIILEYSAHLRNLSPPIGVDQLSRLVAVSNKWLLSRYFHDNKENFSFILERMCPAWIYWLAALGWDLNIQSFSSQTVLLLICTSCNQRAFLKQQNSQGEHPAEPHPPILSSSKILTPCKLPPTSTLSTTVFSTEYMEEMEEEEDQDEFFCHKEWCTHVQNVDGQPFYDYFKNVIINLEKNIGQQGEYLSEKDQIFDMESTTAKKRDNTDLNDEIERFTKLRKLYFVD